MATASELSASDVISNIENAKDTAHAAVSEGPPPVKPLAPPPVRPSNPAPPPDLTAQPTAALYRDGVTGVDSGWSAMAKIVHKVDEQKVQDHKEDIDTILVFAGLFSAVMTAFLIESYQNLREDKMDVMVDLLRQVALQTHTYTTGVGVINSTASPLDQMRVPFQPSTNAVRVNVLWFASLTLSLVSASFAILVKQWLREYLTGDYTSPQARLRIRHFRNPGLAHWKVFEIAAILPLLLQISLALFLVGLCFFTADVHNSIGHTTLPLVAGWGFLFLAATFAPAVSPRCPYKVTLFKSAMRGLRRQLFNVVSFIARLMGRFSDVKIKWRFPYQWSYNMLVYDEEDAVINHKNDVDILISVDSIQSDEQLLAVMWDALQQTQLQPEETVTFLLKILGHRLQRDIPSLPSSSFLNLRALPRQSYSTIMDMVAETLGKEITRQSPTSLIKNIDWSSWMKDCFFILLSDSSWPLTDKVKGVLASCFSGTRHKATLAFLLPRIQDDASFAHILGRLRDAFVILQAGKVLPSLKGLMLKQYCNHGRNAVHNTLLDVIHDHPCLSLEHRQYIVDLLLESLTNEIKPMMTWWSWLLEELRIILELSHGAPWKDKVVSFVQSVIIQSRKTSAYCQLAVGLNYPKKTTQLAAETFYIDAVMASNMSDRRAILSNFGSQMRWQWRLHPEEMDTMSSREQRLDPLAGCLLQLRIVQRIKERGEMHTGYMGIWTAMWRDFIPGLKVVAARTYAGHRDMAKACLELIDLLEPHIPDGSLGQQHGSVLTFNDELVRALGMFLPSEESRFSPHVRRLCSATSTLVADSGVQKEPCSAEQSSTIDDAGGPGVDNASPEHPPSNGTGPISDDQGLVSNSSPQSSV